LSQKVGIPVKVYVNGFSTSLPEDIQFKALRSVV
jgi:tRNA uridine 5-carboxymethylaminomethyl modification enzyme